jgi:ElaB/YqjD/DUF883 family membrane-anchored ribosome-binding protein
MGTSRILRTWKGSERTTAVQSAETGLRTAFAGAYLRAVQRLCAIVLAFCKQGNGSNVQDPPSHSDFTRWYGGSLRTAHVEWSYPPTKIKIIMEPYQQPPGSTLPRHSAGSEISRQAEDLKSEAEKTTQEAKEKAGRAYQDVKQGARQTVKDSVNYAKGVVADQKSTLVSKLDDYKGAMLAASDKLDSDEDGIAAGKIRKAANGLDNLAGYLRETDPSDLFDEASRLARKHPEIVFGGLFVVGLGIARFMKSSAKERCKDDICINRPAQAFGASTSSPLSHPQPPASVRQ